MYKLYHLCAVNRIRKCFTKVYHKYTALWHCELLILENISNKGTKLRASALTVASHITINENFSQ